MGQKVVHFTGPNADVIGPAPIKTASDRCSEWILDAASRQVAAACVRYAHQHLTEGGNATGAIDRHARPKKISRERAATQRRWSGSGVASDVHHSAEPALDVDGHRSAAAVHAEALNAGSGGVIANVCISNSYIDNLSLLSLCCCAEKECEINQRQYELNLYESSVTFSFFARASTGGYALFWSACLRQESSPHCYHMSSVSMQIEHQSREETKHVKPIRTRSPQSLWKTLGLNLVIATFPRHERPFLRSIHELGFGRATDLSDLVSRGKCFESVREKKKKLGGD